MVPENLEGIGVVDSWGRYKCMTQVCPLAKVRDFQSGFLVGTMQQSHQWYQKRDNWHHSHGHSHQDQDFFFSHQDFFF